MNESKKYDFKIAHDIGSLEGQIQAIYENTKVIPELIKKVENHDTQLGILRWVATTTLGALLLGFFGWIRNHFAH